MSEWIKVEDGLPEEGVQVLVYDRNMGLCVDMYFNENWANCGDDVTHWQHLPDSPEGT